MSLNGVNVIGNNMHADPLKGFLLESLVAIKIGPVVRVSKSTVIFPFLGIAS